jgi:hypothetical protein
MKRTLSVVLAFFIVGSALAQSPEPAKVRITTWNLEWFPNGSPREAPQEKQAQRIQAAADVLKTLNPDILLLQARLLPKECCSWQGRELRRAKIAPIAAHRFSELTTRGRRSDF